MKEPIDPEEFYCQREDSFKLLGRIGPSSRAQCEKVPTSAG